MSITSDNKLHEGNLKSINKAEFISAICDFIKSNPDSNLSLQALEDHFKVNKLQIQKIFKKIMGITPKKYVEECRIILFKNNIKNGMPVPEAIYKTGQNYQSWLSSSKLGMGIKQYKSGGIGVTIKYNIFPSKIGMLLVAETEKGICCLDIGSDKEKLFRSLKKEYPRAILIESDELKPRIAAILGYLDGSRIDMPLDIYGTEFQVRVWTAIKAIPYGETKSYSEIADDIGMPRACRAVANACGANPVPLIIPCHRVVGKNGNIGGYGPGVDKKKFLLELEKVNRNKINVK